MLPTHYIDYVITVVRFTTDDLEALEFRLSSIQLNWCSMFSPAAEQRMVHDVREPRLVPPAVRITAWTLNLPAHIASPTHASLSNEGQVVAFTVNLWKVFAPVG